METKSSKQLKVSDISLWNKYSTDIFFRTTCHIIVLQIALTVIIVSGLWFVMQYLVSDTSKTLINTFEQMLKGKTVTADDLSEGLEAVRLDQFWPVTVITTAVIISFGFIMIYVSLTPTRRSLERKKRFVGNIAHELRTPLAILRTNTDVALLDAELPPKVRAMLKRNIVEFDRVSEIMNNLLSLSNFMRDERMQFAEVDLSKVAEKALNTLEKTLDHKDITLTLKTHTTLPVIGNASALEQVVFNLVKNAITYTQKHSVILVEIEPALDGKYINLSVSDTGKGIARDDLFRIFEPFYRARTSPKNGGQGLGLAIVNEIIQVHRGKINIQSAQGRGTKVTVSIQRSPQEAPAKETPDAVEEISMDFSHRILP
jgi:two-component system phosphate regulon sensor histidine kinase PhoR